MPYYYYQPFENQRDRGGPQNQQHTSFSSQHPLTSRPVPRARSPLSSRARQRPRVASRPGPAPASASTIPSRGRARAKYAQRSARNVFNIAMTRYMEQQQQEQQHHRAGGSSRANGNANANANTTHTNEPSNHQSHAGSAVGNAITGVLLEQLIQEILEYLIRHNFFRKRRNTSAPRQRQPDQSRQVDTGTQTSQSSTEQRRRHRRRRHSEVMITSLDRLSSELEATYDTLMRILHEPSPDMDEGLRKNADDLRRAVTRCMARVESVQTRNRRSRRARGTVGLSRETTGRSSR